MPRFNDDAPFNMEHWYASEDLERRRFGRLRMFPASRFGGKPSIVPRSNVIDSHTVRLTLPEAAGAGETALCASEVLRTGEKLAIDGPGLKMLLVRTTAGIRAYDRRCPHRGIDLCDGHRDADVIFCPGHGVAFSLTDGSSKCAALKLRPYDW